MVLIFQNNYLTISRKIGPISHVWTEKELIDVAAEEFNEVKF